MGRKVMRENRFNWYSRAMAVIASIYFVQMYAGLVPQYLNLSRYMRGQERMPFQARELMRYPLLLGSRSSLLQHLANGHKAVNTPELLTLELISCLSLLMAGWASVKIYRFVAPQGRVPYLPWAILLVVCLFDLYCFASYAFPYDLPSLMFLGWGTYFILTRRFAWLLPIFILGTINRETTLFLIFIALLVAMAQDGKIRFSAITRKDVLQLATLSLIWIALYVSLHRLYAGNPSEAGFRVKLNLHYLARPEYWPRILSASAFLLPYVYLKRSSIRSEPLRACLLALPLWVLILLAAGQILELRIYIDISVLIAVAAALILSAEIAPDISASEEPAPIVYTNKEAQ
jgi:hypothetical protein